MRLAGYAALFDVPDASRDVIVKGAFTRSLTESPDPLPLFWQHRPEQRIGWVCKAQEDDRGLRIIAEIDNPDGRAGKALDEGDINGLSFGYRARGYRNEASGRVLEDIELLEISLVTHPLQNRARVHLVTP